jgi:hypothetical protein
MNVWDDFESYIKTELESVDFNTIYHTVKDKSEYDANHLRHILLLSLYHQNHKKEIDTIPPLHGYLTLLTDEDERKKILLPQLLSIISYCCRLRDKNKSQNNLYL